MNAFNDAERRGISLVEFMVVISILGLLVALLLPALQGKVVVGDELDELERTRADRVLSVVRTPLRNSGR